MLHTRNIAQVQKTWQQLELTDWPHTVPSKNLLKQQGLLWLDSNHRWATGNHTSRVRITMGNVPTTTTRVNQTIHPAHQPQQHRHNPPETKHGRPIFYGIRQLRKIKLHDIRMGNEHSQRADTSNSCRILPRKRKFTARQSNKNAISFSIYSTPPIVQKTQ